MSDRALWQEFCKMEADRDRLRAALAEMAEAFTTDYPAAEAGMAAQIEWGRRRGRAMDAARAALAGAAAPACESRCADERCRRTGDCQKPGNCIAPDQPGRSQPASGGHTMDEGPWTVIRDKVSGYGIGVGSDDFKRDVLLRVDGDFGCGVEKTDYCAWLARTLNQIGGRSHCPHCGQWHNMDAGC